MHYVQLILGLMTVAPLIGCRPIDVTGDELEPFGSEGLSLHDLANLSNEDSDSGLDLATRSTDDDDDDYLGLGLHISDFSSDGSDTEHMKRAKAKAPKPAKAPAKAPAPPPAKAPAPPPAKAPAPAPAKAPAPPPAKAPAPAPAKAPAPPPAKAPAPAPAKASAPASAKAPPAGPVTKTPVVTKAPAVTKAPSVTQEPVPKAPAITDPAACKRANSRRACANPCAKFRACGSCAAAKGCGFSTVTFKCEKATNNAANIITAADSSTKCPAVVQQSKVFPAVPGQKKPTRIAGIPAGVPPPDIVTSFSAIAPHVFTRESPARPDSGQHLKSVWIKNHTGKKAIPTCNTTTALCSFSDGSKTVWDDDVYNLNDVTNMCSVALALTKRAGGQKSHVVKTPRNQNICIQATAQTNNFNAATGAGQGSCFPLGIDPASGNPGSPCT